MRATLRTDTALYLLSELEEQPWWRALSDLVTILADGGEPASVQRAYARLLSKLALGGYASLRGAAARSLLLHAGPTVASSGNHPPEGVRRALHADLKLLFELVNRDYAALLAGSGAQVPPLEELADEPAAGVNDEALAAAAAVVAEGDSTKRVELYLQTLAEFGGGPAALYPALSFQRGALVGVPHPDRPTWGELIGLEEQLGRLARNVEALLAGAESHHTLLYGPRGSGKSTAVRGLLERYSADGLRLVELTPEVLGDLSALADAVRGHPRKFVVYVDDLAFGAEEAAYRPLKSLLEGSLHGRPANMIVVATSNRRHLVKERMSDRPDPEDDVHGWDTHHERLALADRFGLTITFPSASQRDYLEIVSALAALRGVMAVEQEQALKFAEWGNGYSGRTARQFVAQLGQGSSG